MERRISDEHLDRLMRRFLVERDHQVAATARPAAEVARIGRIHLARGTRRPMAAAMPRSAQRVVALLLAALLAALAAGAAIVGSRIFVADPDPLAGWVIEEVEPGVVRVVNDGFRDLAPVGPEPGRELALGDDGSVWLWSEGKLQRLGGPDREPPIVGPHATGIGEEDLFIGHLLIDPDGVPWAGGWGVGIQRLDGDAWTPLRSGYSSFDISSDGTLWSAWPGGYGGVSRLTPSGWEDHAIDRDLARSLWPDPDANIYAVNPQGLSAAPDGSAWVGISVEVEVPNNYGHLLLRFDGEAWSELDPLNVGSYSDMATFDVGPDGTAWVYLDQGDPGDPHLARLSDGTWTVYSSDDGVKPIGLAGEAAGYVEVDQAGRLWVGGEVSIVGGKVTGCGGVRSFDGSRWHRYLDDVCVRDLDIAPDGSVWVVGAVGAKHPRPGPWQPETWDTYRIDPTPAEAGEGGP